MRQAKTRNTSHWEAMVLHCWMFFTFSVLLLFYSGSSKVVWQTTGVYYPVLVLSLWCNTTLSEYGGRGNSFSINVVLHGKGRASPCALNFFFYFWKWEWSVLISQWSILPSLHNQTHSKPEAWAHWSARPKICFNCYNKLSTEWIRDTSNSIVHAPKQDM